MFRLSLKIIFLSVIIVLLGYVAVGMFFFPKEATPRIDFSESMLKDVFNRYDERFIGVRVKKSLTEKERSQFIDQFKVLNPKLTRRDLTEFVGFNLPIDKIATVDAQVLIDCRRGLYCASSEEYHGADGKLILYVSVGDKRDKEGDWVTIPENSKLDNIAKMVCEHSRY